VFFGENFAGFEAPSVSIVSAKKEKMDVLEDVPEEEEVTVELTLRRIEGGVYEAELPFISSMRPKDNREAAKKKAFRCYNTLKKEGQEVMFQNEALKFLNDGFAEEIENDPTGYYIPLQAVIRPNAETTKVRVVMNASYGVCSLNDVLFKCEAKGLNILPHILRCRLGPYLVMADLKQAFLKVNIVKEHRKYIRFVLYDGVKYRYFEMKVLPFGLVCAPAILTTVVEMIVADFPDDVREYFVGSTYMDDTIIVGKDEDELCRVVKYAQEKFAEAGFTFHKIKSNSVKIMEAFGEVPAEEVKILGCIWHCVKDKLSVKIPAPPEKRTKRGILSAIGKLFDAIGLIDPIKLWFRGQFRLCDGEWDEEVDDGFFKEIVEFYASLKILEDIRIDRYISGDDALRVFTDASQEAAGYVIYRNGVFVYGKSKLAKKGTIPELELYALYDCMKFLEENAAFLKPSEITVCSDSKVNLLRLSKSPNAMKVHVGRKVLKILEIGHKLKARFFHIEGVHNPADMYSRSTDVASFMAAKPWIVDFERLMEHTVEHEVRQLFTMAASHSLEDEADEFLKRNRKELVEMYDDFAEMGIEKAFVSMEEDLRKAGKASSMTVMRRMIGVAQAKFMDDLVGQDVLKIGDLWYKATRVKDLNMLIVPKGSFVWSHLLMKAHLASNHAGACMSLAQLPADLHLPGGEKGMKKLVQQCAECMKLRKKTANPLLGPPRPALMKFAPFKALAFDICGPFELRNRKKYYGLVAICLSARLINVEVLENLTAKVLKAAMKSIFDQRGWPNYVQSDQGTNFVKVRDEFLADMVKDGRSTFEWSMAVPHGQFQNGSAESAVKLFKATIKVINERCISLPEVHRMFKASEAIMNSRPVLKSDKGPVSAFELAYGHPFATMFESEVSDQSECLEEWKTLWHSQFLKKLIAQREGKDEKIAVGDYVLLPRNNKLAKRKDWPLGQVTRLQTSKDGVVRSVWIKTDDDHNELQRPVRGLVILRRECDGTNSI